MFKFGLAFVFVVLFVCSCCANPLVKDPDASFQTGQRDQRTAEIRQRRSMCGDISYDPASLICCAGSLQNKPALNAKCCWSLAYDPNVHRCCFPDGLLCPTVKKIASDAVQADQRAAEIRQRRSFCDGTTYDPTFKMCCGGTLQDRTGITPKCCGTEAYDADFKMCCQGFVQDKAAFLTPRCCGTAAYDADFRNCCYRGWFGGFQFC